MIERKRHLREIIETKSMQIRARESLIEDQRKEIHEWQKENEVLHQENKELRFDNEELSELVKRIKNLAESNSYNNKKSILNKIKELVSDFENNY